jgi:DNA polymerase III subunit delta'
MEKQKKTIWPLIGNRHVSSFLEKSLAADNLAGAYIFLGPRDLGKSAAALFFARAVLCQKRPAGSFAAPCGRCQSCARFAGAESGSLEFAHGDFHLLKKSPDKKNISVEEVRDFIRLLSLSSFLGSYKIGLIKEAEFLSQEAANALLKTLEEPRPKTVIILTVARLENLPKTVISRSQVLRFAPVKLAEIHDFLIEEKKFSRTSALNSARLSLGRPALAAKFSEDSEFRAAYDSAASCFLDFFRQGAAAHFLAIDSLLSGRGQEEGQAKKVSEILSVWRGLGRDLLLFSSGQGFLAQNGGRTADLEKISQARPRDFWPDFLRRISAAEEYLRANVNPRLVLEGLAVGL